MFFSTCFIGIHVPMNYSDTTKTKYNIKGPSGKKTPNFADETQLTATLVNTNLNIRAVDDMLYIWNLVHCIKPRTMSVEEREDVYCSATYLYIIRAIKITFYTF